MIFFGNQVIILSLLFCLFMILNLDIKIYRQQIIQKSIQSIRQQKQNKNCKYSHLKILKEQIIVIRKVCEQSMKFGFIEYIVIVYQTAIFIANVASAHYGHHPTPTTNPLKLALIYHAILEIPRLLMSGKSGGNLLFCVTGVLSLPSVSNLFQQTSATKTENRRNCLKVG